MNAAADPAPVDPTLVVAPPGRAAGRSVRAWALIAWHGERGIRWWLLALIAFAWLAATAGVRPHTLPDEGRYAGVAWEMLRSGNWLLPTENGLPFFHKPPLFYWITAASMRLFGTGEWQARMAPLLASTFGALAMVALLRRWASDAHARWVYLMLLSMPAFLIAAQYINLDMLVAACIAGAIAAGADAALCLRSDLPHRRALMLAYGVAAVGVLAKGLIGLVLPGLVLFIWLVGIGQARLIWRMMAPAGLAVFTLVAAPWFIEMEREYTGFLHYFFVYHHFTRFTRSGFNNEHGWWFFFVVVPILTLPWSVWLMRSPWRARAGETDDAVALRRLMWVWLLTVLVFFSIPRSKPLGYALPALFPLGALAADACVAWLRERSTRRPRGPLVTAAVAAVLAVAVVIYSALTYTRDNTALARQLAQLRKPGEPVVFWRDYFFDVPYHAHLLEPVAVVSNWRDPAIATHDDWRRELTEAAAFAPELAPRLLVDERVLRDGCGKPPTWVVATKEAHGEMASIRGAVRVSVSKRNELWRVAFPASPPSRAATP